MERFLVALLRWLIRRYLRRKNATYLYGEIRREWQARYYEENELSTNSYLKDAFEASQFKQLEPEESIDKPFIVGAAV